MSMKGLSLRWRIIVVVVALALVMTPLFMLVARRLPPVTAMLVVGSASGLALSALLYVLLEKHVMQPLEYLAESAEALDDGAVPGLPAAQNDEVGAVARVFGETVDRLRGQVLDLEKQLDARTISLERRAMQLEAVSQVSTEAAHVRSVDALLDTAVRAVSENFGFYHVGIFVLDDEKAWAILRAASSEGGQRMLARGHRLSIGQTGIVGFVSDAGAPRIALDVGDDAVWFDNPDLPATRSEMALPMKIENEVIGVLDVQSEASAAFTDEDISALQLMADQLAVALDNARSHEAMESVLAEARELQVDYSRQGWARVANQGRPLAYEYDRVDVSPVPPLPVPQALLDGGTQTELLDGGVPVVMEALRAGDRVLGYLGLSDSQRIWSDEELALVESVGEQVAMALENARLFEESQQSQHQQTLISNVLQVASDPELSFEQVLSEIARVLAQALSMAVGVCTFVQPNAPRFQVHTVLDATGQRLPFSDAMRTLTDEHRIFFRGLTQIEMGPIGPLLSDGEWQVLDAASRSVLDAFDLNRVFYVPLGTPGALSGFVVMIQYRENAPPLDPDTRSLVERLADQIEVVLENLTLTEETAQRSEELQSLYRISLVLSELLEPDDVLSAILEQGATLLDADAGAFFAYDAETGDLAQSLDHGGGGSEAGYRLQSGEDLPGKALVQQETLIVDDYETWDAHVPALRSDTFRAMMAVPLIGRFGPLGVLMLRSTEAGAFGDREVRLSNLFAQQAAAALDNARLNRDAQQRAEEFSLLSQAGIDLLPIRNIEELLAAAADWTRRIFDAPRVVIFLKDAVNDRYLRGRSLEGEARILPEESGTPSPGGFTEMVMTSNESLIVYDNRENPSETSQRLVAAGLLSQMGVPLRVGDEVLGAIFVNGTEAYQFNDADVTLLEFLATQVSSAIQNVFQFARTEAALAVVRRQARYQANVSQAAALLTERGTEALSDVLRLVGEASDALAAMYFEFHAETGDLHWQVRDMWASFEIPPGMANNPMMSYLPLGDVLSWAEELISKPCIAIKVEDLPGPESGMFRALGMGAVLVLAVRGEDRYPSVILLGRADADTSWQEEEIVALQTAAVTLSNTIARERVFQEVQASRTETEALYRGSAELNVARTYDGILNVVRNYTALGQGASHITLQIFNRPWTEDNEPEFSEVVAHWTTTGVSVMRRRFFVKDFPSSQVFVQNPSATIIEDVAHDDRLTRRNRALFSRMFKATTVIFVPLIAGGQKVGFLHAMYPHRTSLSEQEMRRLESLTQQAAIATQNRLQLLSIEARVNRERMIREITEQIQAAPDVQGVLQAAVRELGRAFGTSRNRIQFRLPRQDAGGGEDEA